MERGLRVAYRNFKVHHLICKGRHLIVEAEAVLAGVLRRKDEVSLAFFLPFHDFLVIRTIYRIVDVEGAARLYLKSQHLDKTRGANKQPYRKVKGDFGILSLDVGEETGFLAGPEFVGQCCAVNAGDGQSQQAEENRQRPHVVTLILLGEIRDGVAFNGHTSKLFTQSKGPPFGAVAQSTSPIWKSAFSKSWRGI